MKDEESNRKSQRESFEVSKLLDDSKIKRNRIIIIVTSAVVVAVTVSIIIAVVALKKKEKSTEEEKLTEEEMEEVAKFKQIVGSKIRKSLADAPLNNDTQFFLVSGSFLTDKEKMLNRINKIRYEACEEGVRNPETGKPLTLNDYYPLKWSTDLERIARIRALECIFSHEHKRVNGGGIFDIWSNGVNTEAEIIAWNTKFADSIKLINQFYSEKKYWVNNDSSKVYGHYVTMISTSYRHIGFGLFETDIAEFDRYLAGITSSKKIDEQKFLDEEKDILNIVDVENKKIVGNLIEGKDEMVEGDIQYLAPRVKVKMYEGKSFEKIGLLYPYNYQNYYYKSTNRKVAKVLPNGKVVAIKRGTTKIDCFDEKGELFGTINIKVNCRHDFLYNYTKEGSKKVKGYEHCKKCDLSKEFYPPSNFKIYWRNNVTAKDEQFWTCDPINNPIGSLLEGFSEFTDGDEKYEGLNFNVSEEGCIKLDKLENKSFGFIMLKNCNVTLTIYMKYNPYFSKKYSIPVGS